jgi:excisionase family DNA binding protein
VRAADATTERFLTMSETARLLNLSERSIRRYIDAGRLPAYRLPGGWRVRESELEAFLARHRAQPQTSKEPHDLTAQLSLDGEAALAELGERLRLYLGHLRDDDQASREHYRGALARSIVSVTREPSDEAVAVEALLDVLGAIEELEEAADGK